MSEKQQQTIAREMPGLSLPAFVDNLDPNHVTGWYSSVDATLGFKSASFSLYGNKNYLEDWFFNGLGRQITRYAPDGQFTIWDGFVNSMTLYEPGLRSIITLDGLANSVQAQYASMDTTTNPPTTTILPTLTAAGTDTDSIARYGTHSEIVNAGQVPATLATQIRDQQLQRLAWPQPDDTADSEQKDLRLDFQCRGWGYSLAWRIYNQTTNSGAQNANVEVSDILTLVGQFIATSVFATNATQIPKYHQDSQRALDLILAILAVGDSSNNRWIAPVLEARTLYYRQARTSVDYYRRIADNSLAVYEKSGRKLPPWEVRPDHWLRLTDLYPFKANDPVLLQSDPQVKYVEEVIYSEPYGLQLLGAQRNRLAALQAAQSLLGVRVT